MCDLCYDPDATCMCYLLVSVCPTWYSECPMVAVGTANDDAYLSDDSVDPDDMTYEVKAASQHML